MRERHDHMTTPTRAGALLTLLSSALALGLAGLLAPSVCLLALLLIVCAGVAVPRWVSWLVSGSPQRTGLAVFTLFLLVLATAVSGPGALNTGGLESTLGAAAGELALPTGVPIGLLAALTAGALAAVPLELADRRGVQSALVLGVAVMGLASVAAPGRHLLPALVLGWPSVLFTMARLAGGGSEIALHPTPGGYLRRTSTSTSVSGSSGGTSGGRAAGWVSPGLIRWNVWPVAVAIMLSCALLGAAMLTGVAKSTVGRGGWTPRLGLGGSGTGSESRAMSDYLGGTMDLNLRGDLGTEALFKVPVGAPRLWRAGTLDLYTGASWLATASPGGVARFVSTTAGDLSLVTTSTSDSAVPTPSAVPVQPVAVRRDWVRLLRRDQAQILAPGRLVGVHSARLAGTRVFSTAGDRLAVVNDDGGLDQYQVRSQVLPQVDDPAVSPELLAAGPALRSANDPGDPRWTALPESLPARVRQLGVQLVTTSGSRLAAVQAIEAELAQRVTYSLNSPVPAAGADAVDDVLFTSHSGFCEQFASSEAVLLRTAGIPSRVAVGFSGGEPGPDGYRTVHRADAHAWVEVWFPGLGWVSSDPTPPGLPTHSWWQPARDFFRRLLATPVTWILLLVVMLSAAGLVQERRRVRRSSGSDPRHRLDRELAEAFTHLEAELAAQGRGRAANETVAALSRRLPSPALNRALAVLERALYSPIPPSRAECLAAAAVLEAPLEPTLDESGQTSGPGDGVVESTVDSNGSSSTIVLPRR